MWALYTKMKFQAYGKLYPPAKFGVPDGDALVFKGGKDINVHTPSIMAGPLIVVGWGSMPKYREDEEAVKSSVIVCDVKIELSDNYFVATAEDDEFESGKDKICNALERFVNALSVIDASLFKYQIDTIRIDEDKFYKPPDPIEGKFVGYDLDLLKEEIQTAPFIAGKKDEILDRAIFYFNLALVIHDLASGGSARKWEYYSSLAGSALLNLYKAATVIVGDPSQRGDAHQSRMNALSFNEEERTIFREIKEFRDSYDIAHYSLDNKKSEEIHKKIERYRQFVSSLIKKYAKSLLQS